MFSNLRGIKSWLESCVSPGFAAVADAPVAPGVAVVPVPGVVAVDVPGVAGAPLLAPGAAGAGVVGAAGVAAAGRAAEGDDARGGAVRFGLLGAVGGAGCA